MIKQKEKSYSLSKPIFTIKAFDPSLKKEFLDLFIKTFAEKPWEEDWSEETVIKNLNKILLACDRCQALTIFFQDRAAGFILGYLWAGFFPFNKVFYLDQLFVDSTYQNKGLGKKLLTRLITILQAQKVKLIILLTKKHSPAEKFYQKQGFNKLGITLPFKQKIIMYKIFKVNSLTLLDSEKESSRYFF